MMKSVQEFLKESILDDLVGSFDTPTKAKPIPKAIKVKPSKRYKPRKFKGIKTKDFAEYIRSESELKDVLKENTGSNKITLKGIIDLYANHNYKVADNIQPDIILKELHTIREYDRKLVNGFTGKNTEEEMVALIKSIKSKGITSFGVVSLERKPNGDVTAILGEGNHRLSIGMALKIKTMPIMFYYR